MSTRASVVHSLPGRTRVRIPSRRGDSGFFQRLSSSLEAMDQVTSVRANPQTGGILILHDLEEDGLRQALRTVSVRLSAEPRPQQRPVLTRQMADHVLGWNRKVADATDGALDLDTLWFVFLGGAAALQALRGRVLPAAVSLLMYAGRNVRSAGSGGPDHPDASDAGDPPTKGSGPG